MRILRIKAYEGRNIYSHRPVVAMLVDLGRYAGRKTTELPEFKELLLEALPGLKAHHCATSRPGGFVWRLEDGTFLGHVIEHVALELQVMAGWPVIYGKTRQVDQKGTYNVVFECSSAAGGTEAGRRAVEIVRAVAARRVPDVSPHIEAIKEAAERADLGPSTRAIAEEARSRGIPVRRLGSSSLLVLGHGSRQRRVWATVTSRTPCPAVDLAGDKALTKELLSGAGVPVPPGFAVTGRREALRALGFLGPPVVVKPVDGNQGQGVTLNVTTPEDLWAAFAVAERACKSRCPKVLVEKQVFGRHYRLLVVDGRVVAAAERLPAQVVGDGVHTVRELVDLVNADPRRGRGHERPLTRIVLDEMCLRVLARQGLGPDSVPERGTTVLLRENANLSSGGTARDVTDEVHPEQARLGVRAAGLLGLDVAGVDIVARDIALPPQESEAVVLEVNAAPGLRMHLYPSEGRPRAVAAPILDSLFRGCQEELPPGWPRRGPWARTPGRIPIVAVTGTNGKTTVSRLIAHTLSLAGLDVGLASTAGAWVGARQVMQGDCAGPQTAAALLLEPTVQAAVLETARGGIIRDGLAFDQCDVGLVTNISADHEGQDGLERLEDLAFVKALVVEAVAREGHAVLNAGDPFVHGMAGRARGQVVYFSRTAENLVVRKHLLRGGRAVFRAGDALVLQEGGSTRAVIPLAEVPITLGGLLGFQVENAAAATAAVWSLGLPVSVIRRALRTFGRPDLGDGYAANPGRFQLWRQGGRTIVLDYGHNRAAYAETLGTVRGLAEGDVLSVVGAPGDRLDAHLVEMGRLAARSSDYVYIKEDVDTRGRARGEVASLFLKGVLDTGFPEARVEVVLDEQAALERALFRAAPSDWIVVFYEKEEPLRDYLLGLGARAVCPARLVGARVRERAPSAGDAEAAADPGRGETPGDSAPSEGTAPTVRPVPLSGEGGPVQG